MINTDYFNEVRKAVTGWTKRPAQKALREYLDRNVLAGKEILHGVKLPDDAKEQVKRCLTFEKI